MHPSIAVVVNSKKFSGKQAKALRAALNGIGESRPLWLEVEKGLAATKAARKAVAGKVSTVIACGGDGTVRATAEALVNTNARLAVVPAGTANLFATAFGLPSDVDDIARLIRSGSERTIDTGVCNGKTFVGMAGVGFDAAMIDSAEDGKERYGTLAYLRAGVRQAKRREPFPVNVTVDGTVFFEGAATCVLVGNTSTLRGGIRVFPDGSPTDGQLDLAVLTSGGLREWAGVLVAAVRHRQDASTHAQLGRGTAIVVTLDGKHRFELDGGVKGRAKSLEFDIEPQSLRVHAPQSQS